MRFRETALCAIAIALIGGLALSHPAAAGGRGHHGYGYGHHGYRGHGSGVIVTFGHGSFGYRHSYRTRPVVRYHVVRPVVVYQAYTPPVVVQTAPAAYPVAAPAPTAGQYCREYVRTVTIDGRAVEAYGTACREADGSWRIVATE